MKTILMNPGPVNVTPSVRRALLKPDICHRECEFSDLMADIRQKLPRIFGVSRTHELVLFTGSGTSALEALLIPIAASASPVLCLSNGVYGERIRKILELHRARIVFLTTPLGSFPSPESIESALKKNPGIRAITMVHHETSSGMLNPLPGVARLAKKYGKLLAVDAISSIAGEALNVGSADFLAGTSGKCLHGFPGVSFVFMSKKAIRLIRSAKPDSLSLDISAIFEEENRGETPFTPAVQIFYALQAALNELIREGLPNRIRRYKEKGEFIWREMNKRGIRFLIEEKSRSHVLTAFYLPKGMTYEKLHDCLKKQGFVIYAGQSALKGKIFRIANLGDISPADLRRFFRALDKALS